MYNSTNIPLHKIVFYVNDAQMGCYIKTPQQPDKTPVMRLPYQLIFEITQLQKIKCNATQLIRGKEKFKKGEAFKFFTGLQHTDFKEWYSGNDYEKLKGQKKLSLCLFHFSADSSRLTVVYFGRFYIDNPAARERFINEVIPYFNTILAQRSL